MYLLNGDYRIVSSLVNQRTAELRRDYAEGNRRPAASGAIWRGLLAALGLNRQPQPLAVKRGRPLAG